MTPLIAVIAAVAGLGSGALLGWRLEKSRRDRDVDGLRRKGESVLADAEKEAGARLRAADLEIKERSLRAEQDFASRTEETRRELARRTETLDQRDAGLDKKVLYLDQKEAKLEEREQALAQSRRETDALRGELAAAAAKEQAKLEELAGLSRERAREILMETMVGEARMSAARTVKDIRDEAERTARRSSQKILSLAIQRYAAEHVAETSVSVVDLPNDEMKGRIIGREGRNIRSFELATGVDVIIDDTPEAVIISGFDPVRREVACRALRTLIGDGRIHPGRIEEVVAKAEQEMQEHLREIGEQACLELDLQRIDTRLHPLIGRLHYRTSYGQNLLLHSKEVAAVAAGIAQELGLDPVLARRCGFLHDIGKAVDHEQEGPHAGIGGRLARKFGEHEVVVNAVEGHHEDVEAVSPYTFITAAADAVSASRPGARRESLDNYIKRLESLERIADSFQGVEKSYAIQAGREIRILVDHTQVSDEEATLLAEEISRRVEGELEYPGQIKVMVLRESRAVSYAR
ncbi:MAG TPA: ribonuclease Y [Candidatus Krumholzibacteria bacterium]|nr:ribonuclease Y [Candidatus Krumholzibacteria bacterium]